MGEKHSKLLISSLNSKIYPKRQVDVSQYSPRFDSQLDDYQLV